MRPRRILHVITDLNVGGAEIMLTRLATAKPGLAEETRVVSLLPNGFFADELRAAGIPVIELNFRTPIRALVGIVDLVRLIADMRPDIVQGWMYHGDLAALPALILSGRRSTTRLVWNIRCSGLDFSHYGRLLRLVVRACVALSAFPDLVIANSRTGMDAHRMLGYRPRRSEIVPNGIDLERYKPDAGARAAVRDELDIPENVTVLAHVARVDPMKDHQTFLLAMKTMPDVQALMIGSGTEHLPAPPNVRGLGRRADIPRLLAAADFVVSSSAFGEGFSNATAEGMACGLPPIATRVGDAPMIVGDTGLVVPPSNPDALAEAIRELTQESRDQRANRGARARLRIRQHFSLDSVRVRFAEVYANLLEDQD